MMLMETKNVPNRPSRTPENIPNPRAKNCAPFGSFTGGTTTDDGPAAAVSRTFRTATAVTIRCTRSPAGHTPLPRQQTSHPCTSLERPARLSEQGRHHRRVGISVGGPPLRRTTRLRGHFRPRPRLPGNSIRMARPNFRTVSPTSPGALAGSNVIPPKPIDVGVPLGPTQRGRESRQPVSRKEDDRSRRKTVSFTGVAPLGQVEHAHGHAVEFRADSPSFQSGCHFSEAKEVTAGGRSTYRRVGKAELGGRPLKYPG